MTSTVCVAPLRKPNINRRALMLSCAASAVAAGTVAPQRAHADAFNGTMANSPAATRINTGTGTETVSINPGASGKVTINWTPNEAGSGTINFLGSGNTATFQSVAGVTDYTVLNRVVPTDATRGISLNGTILSKLNDGSTGGRIWFYSPGGILVGATARIDVGSLLLTTLDPVGFGSSADGFGQFQNQFDQTSTVSIDSLAQINANNAGSYVALIAPRVEQHGSVSVNGSAAYVAAEDVTMTINNGLFDIQVDLGTRDGNGIVHDGTTTGAANVDAGDNHSIYMVAVPKDTALTMLLSGNVGFAAATSATVENGQIVLSAGHNVFQGDFGVQFDQANFVDAGMNLGTGSYTSDVIGQATSDVNVNATTGNSSFSSNLDLTSVDGAVRLTATNGNQLTVSGAGSLTSTKQFNPDLPLDPAIAVSAGSGGKINVIKNLDLTASDDGFGGGFSHGGNIYVTANGGDVTVNGRITADASARDSYPSDESVSDAEGGFIYLRAMNGGKLTVGSVDADASAEGGYTNVQGVSAGDGTAGRVYLHAQSDGLLTVAGNVFATANGIGGDVIGNGDATGNGVGGLAFVRAETGGDVAIGGSLTMHGDGTGGSVRNPVTAFGINGGIGRGSDYLQGDPTKDDGVGIGTFADTSSVTVGGNVTLSANGTGGNGYNGGAAFGGDAGVRTSGGTIAITGNLDFRTTAAGGNAVQAFGGNGGYAEGGNAYVQADLLSGTIASISGANVFLDVGATGGTGGAGNGDNSPGVGGDGRAGTYDGQKDGSGGAFVLADSQGASLALGNITLKAIGTGGAGGAGGAGQNGAIGGQGFGGTANAGTFRTPNFLNDPTAAAVVTFGDVLIDASGQGGAGGAGGASAQQGVGGNGTGGLPCPPTGTRCGGVILSGRGTVSFGNADLIAKGFGGAGSTAGTGVGGDVEVIVRGTGTLTGTGDLKLSAAGFGGNGGTGGSGMGGFAGIEVANTGVLTAGWIYADSGGVGGTGTNAGGSGWGRESYVGTLNSGKINATKLQLWSPGFGGSALGDAGSGNGGWSHIVMQGGEINAGILQVQTFGLGGNSTVGMGGNALGGEATIDVSLAGKITFGSELTIDASATGGNGGINGGGQAGSDDVEAQANAALNVNGGTVTGPGVLTVSTNATAGANSEPDGVGANAYGGESNVSITSGTLQAGSMQVLAGATGGSADSLGGSGYGGVAYMEALSSGAISAATKLFIDASGTGGGATGQGGYGEGGEGTLYLNGGSVTVTSTSLDDTNPTFQISTFGNGGSGAIGGDAQGGDTSFLYGSGGSMSVAGFGVLWANANGGVGTNDDFGNGGAGGNATGGTVTFNSPGNVTVASLRLAANGFGGDGGAGDIDGNGGDGGNATGGTVTADIYGNTTTGNLVLRAFGEAGFGGAGINGGRGGDGTGGSSTLTVHSGTLSTAAIEHSTYGFAGDGGAGTTGVGGNGGDALGGTLNFLVGGGSMSAGAIANNANGFGGNGGAAASGVGGAGGNAQGGTSTITIDGALTALGLGSLNQGTAGVGGAGTTQGDGGSGTGGSVTATINGSVNITGLAANNQGNFTMTAFGQGGNGGNGGDGQGGSSTVNNNGILSISNRLQVTAQSLGGDGSSGTGGQGNGGSASLVNTGTLTAVELFQGAGGTGGAGVTAGGDAMAGTATITQVGDMSLAFGNLVANAAGGAASAGDGGDALSGEASLTVTEGGALTSGNLTVSADATGGAGTTSGGDAANEVYARIVVDAGGSAVLSGTTLVSATATGGVGPIGGVGDGGSAQFSVGGSLTAATVQISANGTAAAGPNSGQEGDGGNAIFTILAGGTASLGSIEIGADGFGGGSSAGFGGNGYGGTARIVASGDLTVTGETFVSAEGEGGDGDLGGGQGWGGIAELLTHNGAIVQLGTATNVEAEGTGASATGSGNGGDGYGGYAHVRADGGSQLTANDLTVKVSAEGGGGVAGGDAYGGYPIEGAAGAVVEAADAGSILTLTGSTTIEARAEGGSGTSGLASGFGGFALLSAADSQIDFSTLLMDTTAVGNDGSTAVHRGTARVATHNGSIIGGAVTLLANADTVTGQVQIDANGNGPTGQSMDFATLTAGASGPLGAGDILIDVAAATLADFGVVTLTANGGGVPGAGEDGIEIGSQGTLTASQLTMNSSDGIRISTANGGTINVSGTIDANSQALIRLLDDGAGGAISSNILDLDAADIQITALVQAADILMTLPGDYAINGLPVASNSLRITAGGNITAAANVTYANGLELIAGAGIGILDLAAGGDLTLLAAGNVVTGNLQATHDINLATPGAMSTGSIDAGGIFLALGHGDMSFGDVAASEVFLADFSMRTPSGGVTGNCVGSCGTLGADGDVTAPPSGSTYQYVTTDGGVTGEGQIAGVGGTDGSLYTTSLFTAAAGDDLSFWFNYVTSDGSDFTDYAWAQLLDGNLNPVAMLYTARTQPTGTIVPGQGLPGVEATLNPASVPINPDATTWSALGLDSGSCYAAGCGNTGWINSTYQIANAGTYVLRFGVTNFTDTLYQSGMAFSGISVGGQTVTPGLTPTLGSITIGNVTTGNMTAAAGTTLTTGAINATDFVDLHSGGNMQTGNITAGQNLQADAGGAMNLGALDIGTEANLNALGNLQFGNVDAGSLDFDGGGSVTGGNIVVQANATGTAVGSVTLLDITAGPVIPVDDFSVGIVSTTSSINVGNVSGASLVGFAASSDFTASSLGANDLVMLLVGGDIATGPVSTGVEGRVYLGDFAMLATGGGADDFEPSIVLALAPVATGGSITINGPVNTGLFQAAAGTTFTAGDIFAASSITASAGGNLQVGSAQAGTSIDLSSGGSIVSTSLDAPSVSLTLAGDFTTGDLSVDNSLSITAGGNLTAGNILAGGDLALTAGLVLTALDLSANGDIVLRAGGNIDAGDLSAGGSLNFNSTAGAISVGSLNAVAGGIFASAATGVDIADATVGLGVEIHTGGDLSIGDIDANTGVELDAEGDVLASDIDSASHVIVTSGGDFEVSDVTAGTTADFTAGGLASFLGIVSSPEITVTSADIDIVDGASLGVAGVTDLITFNAASAGQEVILGGDGTEAAAGQYQLAEDGDIESDTVVFNAVGASQGQPVNVRILDAEIEGSATQGGGVSSVTLNTAGSVFVTGVLSFTGAAATDTLAIHAGDSIQVVTDTGGIEMLGSDGNVAGTLDLTAHDIWVADQALLDQLNGASNLSDFEGALATNNGDVVPDGYLRAGGIDVTMLGSSLLVQNTGTDADPAGLTIGDGGLNIVNQGSDPATVIIFGHRQNGDGTTTGGDAFLDEVQFSGPGGFDNSSTVNGCDVDGCGPSGETPGSIGGVESILGPIGLMSDPADLASAGGDDFALPFDEGTDEASDEDDDEDSSDEDSSVDASVGLINTGPVSVEPPVEEPVTSGNDGPGF